MIAERIKSLRESHKLTQAALAKKLDISRSSVNAWELGISVPSTTYVIELSRLLHVSSDYLLGIDNYSTIRIDGLNEAEVRIVSDLVSYFRTAKEPSPFNGK